MKESLRTLTHQSEASLEEFCLCTQQDLLLFKSPVPFSV